MLRDAQSGVVGPQSSALVCLLTYALEIVLPLLPSRRAPRTAVIQGGILAR